MSGILEYDTTPGNNTAINGIGIQGTDRVLNFDNALRQMMADVRANLTYTVEKSLSYTAVKTDHNQLLRFTDAVTLWLDMASLLTNGWCCIVKAENGDITITPTGVTTIDGEASVLLKSGGFAFLYCDGDAFHTVQAASAGLATPSQDGLMSAGDKAKLDVLDKTSDADKPVSTAQQEALDLKQDTLAIPSQAEAEAGTSTVARAWTAQRVAQAIDALAAGGLGFGQTWQTVTRAFNTTYQNTSGNTIAASIVKDEGDRRLEAQVSFNGSTWLTLPSTQGLMDHFFFIVPVNGYYRIQSVAGSGSTILKALELR